MYTTPASITYLDGTSQRYLQNRVSFTYLDEDGEDGTLTDRHYTYYSNDPHGNVEWLVQETPGLGKNYLRYEYDLLSGDVLKVVYNEGKKDQFLFNSRD